MKITRHFPLLLLLSGLLLITSACFQEPFEDPKEYPPFEDPANTIACNGHPELCKRRYDQVTYPTTHKSYNYEIGPTEFRFPNQDYSVNRQLRDGVRGLMIDVFENGNSLEVYHLFTLLGSESFGSVLGEIRDFMDENPHEVVTLILSTDVDGIRIGQALQEAGLAGRVYAGNAADPWPTLKEMILEDKRLVIFTTNAGQAYTPEWYHYAWDFIVDTQGDLSSSADFSCDYYQGDANNSLYMLSHWVTSEINVFGFPIPIPIGSKDQSLQINSEGVLLPRAQICSVRHNRPINFLAVDFYHQGNLFEVADFLNGVAD